MWNVMDSLVTKTPSEPLIYNTFYGMNFLISLLQLKNKYYE
jgi:hypothetical protein